MKDRTLAKYFLDNFMRRINELTPSINFKKNNFSNFKVMTNPLQQTKDINKKRSKFEEKELKELSILYLIINNLDFFRKKVELIPDINFSNKLFRELKQELINFLLSDKLTDIKILKSEHIDKKFNTLINFINMNAPVKIITNNKKEDEIIIIFNEIVSEIKRVDLRKQIESLEDKVSLNLDESLYSELLSLRNQLKSG